MSKQVKNLALEVKLVKQNYMDLEAICPVCEEWLYTAVETVAEQGAIVIECPNCTTSITAEWDKSNIINPEV